MGRSDSRQTSLFGDEINKPAEVASDEEKENEALRVWFDRGGKIDRECSRRLHSLGRKYCPKCKRVKTLHQFRLGKKVHDAWCKDCFRGVDRRRAAARYTDVKDELRESRSTMRTTYIQKLGGKCQRCGYEEFPSSLNFHHVHPESKGTRVTSRIFDKRYKEYGDEDEIDKCTLLCQNCHAGLHNGCWNGKFEKVKVGLGYRVVSIKDGEIE